MAKTELLWNGSTAAGSSTSTAASGLDAGKDGRLEAEGMTKVAAWVSNPSTKDFIFTVEGSAGGSTVETTLIAAPTTGASTGANLVTISTGSFVFTTARLAVSTNNTTGGVKVWLAGA